MVRFLVGKYFPNRGSDVFVNVGVIAQDGENLIAKFCSNVEDLSACQNVDLSSIPLNIGTVFEKNLQIRPARLDYASMKEVEINFGSEEYFDFIRSNSYASHLRYSDVYKFEVPSLTEKVVGNLYELFVKEQEGNPFSKTGWKEEIKRNHKHYAKVI